MIIIFNKFSHRLMIFIWPKGTYANLSVVSYKKSTLICIYHICWYGYGLCWVWAVVIWLWLHAFIIRSFLFLFIRFFFIKLNGLTFRSVTDFTFSISQSLLSVHFFLSIFVATNTQFQFSILVHIILNLLISEQFNFFFVFFS